MARGFRFRLFFSCFVFACLATAALLGCGSDDNKDGLFPVDASGGDATTGDDSPPPPSFTDGGDGAIGPLSISPVNPTVTVTITNGTAMPATTTFQASVGGTSVAAAWSFDRGELGAIATTGVFTASGNLSGTGTVTATYGGMTAHTNCTVSIVSTQNGAPPGYDAGVGGLGGAGGVGGEGLGGSVDGGTQMVLTGQPTPPMNAAELGWLYPYDKTVWPRGMLAPLLQWQTTHSVDAVYIHLTEMNYEFKGFYSGMSLVHMPIDETAWTQATYGNGGDLLHVEIVIASNNVAYGPIKEDWTVAPGLLKGTVYYNSYNSRLTGAGNGAVLGIRPGAMAPTVAVPGTETSCHVCHEVSSDGSTLLTEDSTYSDAASYDLKNMGAVIASYSGTSSDGYSNDRKFLWSALYPDGTFAMANSRHAREHYAGDSLLFKRSDATMIPSTGWTTAVTSAVTPIFSPDGKKLAFNFWEGPGSGGVTAGAGHLLALMDFACGTSADAGVTCGAPPYAFSGLRTLYSDAARYPGWPAFLPDGSGLIFHNTLTAGSCGDCEISTWNGAQAEIWYSEAPPPAQTPTPIRLDALNGATGAMSYLPTNANHPNDVILNYEPTVNPIASGGYYWAVFTSRRMYGNIAAGTPYDNGSGTYPIPKKLWVAAIDLHPTSGKDSSHPAFYLPGQELNAGNLRGFWVVDPCKPNGNSCLTGDECCNGFCRQPADGGPLECTDKPPMSCSNEFEQCNTTADCCNSAQGYTCINGHCAAPSK